MKGDRAFLIHYISMIVVLQKEEVWLGGTFCPEAYITATRQHVAQANTWSLEQLHLHIAIGKTQRNDVFRVYGWNAYMMNE